MLMVDKIEYLTLSQIESRVYLCGTNFDLL